MHLVEKMLFLFLLTCFISCGDQQAPKSPVDNKAEPSKEEKTEDIAEKQFSEEDKEAFVNGVIDYKVIAQDFCECAQKAIQVNTDTETALKNPDDKDKYIEASNQRTDSNEDAVSCCIRVKEQRTRSKLDKLKLSESLKTECKNLHPSLLIQILLKAIY